ncbi:MAG: glycosyltransferase family 2 protein [Candidatus Shapirobacteria bacterium]|jgi:(heptosyl)LPS beta-1,4-glucosyltransferase
MNNKNSISVIVNVRNEAVHLDRCLNSVKGFADEIIVVDMHSTDTSVQIAQKYHAKVYPYRWLRVVEPARNFGISKASSEWILILDPDEYVGKTLKNELHNLSRRSDVDFVKIPRMNLIFGKWLRHANCWPDYLVRFFRKGSIVWKKEIHSQPDSQGNGVNLLDTEKLSIRHNNYQNVTQYLQRAQRYSSVQADELAKNNYKIKTSDFLLKPIQEFNSRFFAGEGYKDGIHGLIFCLLQLFSVCLIYIKLWEKYGSIDKPIPKESFVSASQETIFEYDFWFTKYYYAVFSPNVFKKLIIKLRHLFIRSTKNF